MGNPQIDLSGLRYQNWCVEVRPPVVLNPDADLHSCIAWCWGEANEAHQLAINAQCYEQPVGPLVDAIQARLMALVQMLEVLGSRTAEAAKQAQALDTKPRKRGEQ
jgi:hypothetical protein